MISSLQYQRHQLRKTMQAKRLALSELQQHHAALDISEQALQLLATRPVQTLAFYLPFRGEISPLVLLEQLQQQGKTCVLPVLHPFSPHYLQFVQYHSINDLTLNRFGILEPKLDVRHIVPLQEIELAFVPLVAFDQQYNRLGMGGGFYDRTLAQMPHCIKLGLAHHCQQVECLPTAEWDMPLDLVLSA